MTTLEHPDEIGTRHDVPRFGPLVVEVRTYFLLDCLMLICVYRVAGGVDHVDGSTTCRGHATR
jgi:hypothetical protein